jgi:tRNA(fMet)-specific endonuclease VapC
VIDFLTGRPAAQPLFGHLLASGSGISMITYMETIEGVRAGRDPAASMLDFRSLLLAVDVLDVTFAVAERAADIRLDLRRQKRQIHERALDIIVAATAIEHGLILVTRNLGHVQDVPGLSLDQQT